MKLHRDQLLLLIFQIAAHVGLVCMIIWGTGLQWLATLFMFFIMGCIGTTVTYHRLLSHKSFNSPEWFRHLGIACGTLALIGSSIGWTALHRQHHRFTDLKGDPHSPHQKGFIRSNWFLMFEPVSVKYVPDLLRDPLHVFLHRYYFVIHAAMVLVLFAISPWAVVYLYLAPAALVWTVGGMINSINHLVGYRNYDVKDSSKNFHLLGYCFWGEGWHNNHHADPANPNFGHKWWELDIGYWVIKLVRKKD